MDRGRKGNSENTPNPLIGAPGALTERTRETSSIWPYSSKPSHARTSLLTVVGTSKRG